MMLLRWIVLVAALALAGCQKSAPTAAPSKVVSSAAQSEASSDTVADEEEESEEDEDTGSQLASADTVKESVAIVLAAQRKKYDKACAAGDQKACVEAICTFDRVESTIDEFEACAQARHWRTNENWVQASQSDMAGTSKIHIMCRIELHYERMGDIHPEAEIRVQGSNIEIDGIRDKTFTSVEEAGNEACRYAEERHNKN